METGWGRGVWTALTDLGARLATVLPGLLIMITLIALGLVLGLIVRSVLTRVARAVGFDRYMERWGAAPALRRAGLIRTPADVLGMIVFWAIFILFASLGVDALRGPGGGGATAFVFSFLPPLFTALLIVVVAVAVLGVGYWRGWFLIDRERISADTQQAIDKVKDAGGKVLDRPATAKDQTE